MKRIFNLLILAGIFRTLFRYLDPGTGSLIVQLIIGTVVGLLVVFRNSFGAILYWLGIRKRSEDDDIENLEDENPKDQ
jgi:hypothetical protein